MFDALRIHGRSASILWGYRPAVELASWHVKKDPKTGRWILRATPARIDAFMCRQRPLLFTATRTKGWWAWGIESLEVGPNQVVAQLGKPEQ